MNNTTRVIFIVGVSIVYIAALYLKDQSNIKAASRVIQTVPLIKKEKGTPVFVRKVVLQEFERRVTVSGFVNSTQMLQTFVPLEEKNRLKVGMLVSTQVNNKAYAGKITHISEESSLLSGLYEVDIQFRNFPTLAKKKPVVASISYDLKQNKIVLLRESVSLRADKPFVYIVDEENKIQKREVRIGDESSTSLLISSGLNEGDLVVVSDLRDLSENQKVFTVVKK